MGKLKTLRNLVSIKTTSIVTFLNVNGFTMTIIKQIVKVDKNASCAVYKKTSLNIMMQSKEKE